MDTAYLDKTDLELPPPRPAWTDVLRQSGRALAAAACIGALIGALAGGLVPPSYESTGRLAIVPIHEVTNAYDAMQAASAMMPMLAAVLQSRSLADEAALQVDPLWRDKAAASLRSKLTLVADRKANLLAITVEDRDPRRAQAWVQAITEVAVRREADLWSARHRRDREALELRRDQVAKDLTTAENTLRTFREQHHVIDLPQQIKASVEQAAALEKLRIDKLLSERFARGYGSDEAVEVRRSRRERRDAEVQLQALSGAQAGPLLPLDAVPQLALEASQLERLVAVQSNNYEVVSRRLEELRAAEARPAGRVEVIDPAQLPRKPARPVRVATAALGALALMLLVAAERLRRARRR